VFAGHIGVPDEPYTVAGVPSPELQPSVLGLVKKSENNTYASMTKLKIKKRNILTDAYIFLVMNGI